MRAIVGAGFTAALGSVATVWGVLDGMGTAAIGALQTGLLEPCVAFSTLIQAHAARGCGHRRGVVRSDGRALSPQIDTLALARSAPLLLWSCAHVCVGLALGWTLLPHSRRRPALLLICAFGNAGGLPTAIVPSVLSGASVAEALLCVQMYNFWWRLMMWSGGPALLRGTDATARHKKTDGDVRTAAGPRTALAAAARTLLTPPACASLVGVALGCVGQVQAVVVEGALRPLLLAVGRRAHERLSPSPAKTTTPTLTGSATPATHSTFSHSGMPSRAPRAPARQRAAEQAATAAARLCARRRRCAWSASRWCPPRICACAAPSAD